MSKKRFQELQTLFDRWVDRDPVEQQAELTRIREDDPELASQLSRLLGSVGSNTGVLGNVVDSAADGLAEHHVRGMLVGPYRLIQEVGRGGMGTVYLGERSDGSFEQRVAVKLLQAGTFDRALIERFEVERHILAQLDHHFIARLIDGGTTTHGLPYLVMEYVDGEPIDEYCDKNRLTTSERLALFRDVCAAVASAHRKLVVHRDLKPSNILVTADGSPKLLDFGIAKLLANEAGPQGLAVTVAGERVMTPEYASPEQVRAQPVSTATDVYALGLLLYELLTGQPAHRLQSDEFEEVERVVCHDAPERPSAVVTEDRPSLRDTGEPSTPQAVCEARRTAPLRLKKRLAGDLDNIVMMALRKEPERRYGSVAELSEDLRRHVDGLPVLAHADSWLYRTRKFASRNVAAMVATALVLFSLAAGLIGTTVQARRATAEARRAEETNELLIELLESSDPEFSRGGELTVREVLDRAALRIETELKGQPELQATMQTVIGRLFERLGLYDESEEQLRASLTRREDLFGAQDAHVGETRAFLARVLVGQGRFDEAETQARESLSIRKRTSGARSTDVAGSLSVLALVLQKQGRLDESREAYLEAIEIERALHGPASVAEARILVDLSDLELEAGQLDESERVLRSALAAWRAQGSEKSLDLAAALHALSGTLIYKSSFDEAEEALLESLQIRQDLLAAEHPLVASSLTTVGVLRRKQGDMDAAESAYKEALRMVRSALGSEHPEVGTLLSNLAVLMHVQDRFPEAATYYRESLELRERVLGPEHPLVGTTVSYLAFALHRAGDERAETLYREALPQLVETRGREHPDVANVLNDLGRLLVEKRRYAEAEPMLREALEIRQRAFGDENRRTVRTRLNLGASLVGLGSLDEASSLLQGARAQWADQYSEPSPQVAEADLFVAYLLSRQGNRKAARDLAAASHGTILATHGDDHWLARLSRLIEARL